jgi:hypothetical protein
VVIDEAEARVMIDPSLALSDEGIALFEDEATSRTLALSRSFYEALADESRWPEFDAFGVDWDGVRIRRLRQAAEPIWVEKFSYEEVVGTLTDDASEVLGALLNDGGGLADAAADQWAFLVSHSWLLDKAKRFLERVQRAGAQVWEATAEQMRRIAEFLGGLGPRIANLAKDAARGVEIAIEVGGPALAQALRHHGIPVDERTLQLIENAAGLVVEYDP